MAIRQKTIMYAFPTTTATVADAVVTNLTQITVYIPEASPTFISCFVDVGFRDIITATGGTIGEHRVGLQLGASGYTTITETDDITHTGENLAGIIGPFDFTSRFTSSWTGTSMTCDLQVFFDQTTGTTLGMNNVTAVLYITYQYDDTAPTQIKTVTIPLESLTGTLPTSNTNFGTNQIPQLTGGGILPENSPVIRDWYLLIEGNESINNASATDWTTSVSIDGAGTVTFMTQEAFGQADHYLRLIHKPAVPETTAAHALQLWSSITNRYNHVTVTLVVTYEFILSGTTRVLNSVQVPFNVNSPLGVAASPSRVVKNILCVEPGTLTLRQSGYRIFWNIPASVNLSTRMNGQAFRTYTVMGNLTHGSYTLQQRIDSGGAQGSGITLARGRNEFIVDMYSAYSPNEITNVSGLILLNYESDRAPEGIGAHNDTIQKVLMDWDAFFTDRRSIDYAFDIPETDYFLTGAGHKITWWVAASSGYTLQAEVLPGEADDAGFLNIYTDVVQIDTERNCNMILADARNAFKIFPQDVRPERVDIETSREYVSFGTTAGSVGLVAIISRHSMTWNVAGTLSGNDAGLPTTVHLINNDTNEIVQTQALTAGDTTFDFTVYDNTSDYYVSAYQDTTHVGRSAPGKAV